MGDRRDFIKKASMAGAGLWMASSPIGKALAGNMSSKKIKLGFIGVGGRGRFLLEHLLNQQVTSSYELVAICDIYQPSIDDTLKVCKKYDRKPKVFYKHQELIKNTSVDGVIIATPLFTHAQISIDCMNSGIHVLCEKAMARTLEDVKAMYDTHVNTGSLLVIGHQRMFSQKYLSAMKRIHKGEIGVIGQMKAYWHRNNNWRRPVPKDKPELERQINWRLYKEYSAGVLTELMSHQIQVANWAMQKIPVAVMGTGSIHYYKDGREVPDNMAAIFSYEDGTQFIYDVMTINQTEGCEEHIIGDLGTMQPETNKLLLDPKPKPKPAPGIAQMISDIQTGLFNEAPIGGASWAPETAVFYNGEPIFEGQKGDGTVEELIAFIQFVQEKQAPEWMLKEAYNGSIWTLLTEQAMDSGTKITCPKEFII